MSVPFAWQDKRTLRRIREQVEDYGSALAVYHALTHVASDTSKEEFQTTHKWLGKLSGLSDRTVRRRLVDLERVGAVKIVTPPLRAPCTYTLLPFGNDCRTNGHHVRTLGHGTATPCPTSEEKKKEVGKTPIKPPRTTAERISLERKLEILRRERDRLRDDTSEQWQRDANPEKITERKRVEAEIKSLETALLKS